MVNDNNDKVDRVMALYKKLMNGGLIYKSEKAVLYNVSEWTVKRNIDEICDFLERNERKDGIYNDVVYDRMRKEYRLEQSYKMKLTNPEILAICRQVWRWRVQKKNTIYVWWKITKG